jgi:hypothetical protein
MLEPGSVEEEFVIAGLGQAGGQYASSRFNQAVATKVVPVRRLALFGGSAGQRSAVNVHSLLLAATLRCQSTGADAGSPG